MLLNELCRAAGTTRKAVAYYEEQGLISPRRQENGYREFTPEDAQRVRRITLLRIYRYYRFSGQSGGDPHAGGTGRAASVGL